MALSSYQTVLLIRSLIDSPVGRVNTILLVKDLFDLGFDSTKELVDDINKRWAFTSSRSLCEYQAGEVLLHTGDRVAYVTESFLGTCAPDHAQALRETKDCLIKLNKKY